jgi:hypothetical protein
VGKGDTGAASVGAAAVATAVVGATAGAAVGASTLGIPAHDESSAASTIAMVNARARVRIVLLL